MCFHSRQHQINLNKKYKNAQINTEVNFKKRINTEVYSLPLEHKIVSLFD